jgi:hypothetical protein
MITVTYYALQCNEYWLLILINHWIWCTMITGFNVMVIRCGGVADIGAVSHTHMIFNTPILWKKKTYLRKVVVSAIHDDVTDTGNISVSDLVISVSDLSN